MRLLFKFNCINIMNFHKYTFLHSLSVLTNFRTTDNLGFTLIYGNRQLNFTLLSCFINCIHSILHVRSFFFIALLARFFLLYLRATNNKKNECFSRCISNGACVFIFDKVLCFCLPTFAILFSSSLTQCICEIEREINHSR